MVAVCRDQLSGVAFLPIETISGASILIEKGVPVFMEAPSVNPRGPSSSIEVLAPASHVSPSSFQGAILPEGCS